MPGMSISSITALVNEGKTVLSGEDSMIVDAVLKAAEEGRKATFYVTRELYSEIMGRFWTPERVREVGLEPVSDAEARQIRASLNLEVNGYSNRIDCPRCGHIYGMREFLEQGIKEHGRDIVEGVISLEGAAVIRVNPVQTPVCPNCDLRIQDTAHAYLHDNYGCCRME